MNRRHALGMAARGGAEAGKIVLVAAWILAPELVLAVDSEPGLVVGDGVAAGAAEEGASRGIADHGFEKRALPGRWGRALIAVAEGPSAGYLHLQLLRSEGR